MTSKRINPKNVPVIASHVDHERVALIFSKFNLPASSFKMAHQRLDTIIKGAHTIEEDSENNNGSIAEILDAFQSFKKSLA